MNPTGNITPKPNINNFHKDEVKSSPVNNVPEKTVPGFIEDKVDIGGSSDADDDIRKNDSTNDGASVGANVADHLNESPMLEKLNALIAGALVVSGLKQIKAGIKEKNRDKILKGSKKTMWGVYHGLHAFETVFRVSLCLTPGLRAIGGFLNADLGFTALYKDYKDDKKFKTDKAIFHTGAAAWGLRHVALGLAGLSKTKWMTGLAKGNRFIKDALTKAPILGAVGMGLGIAGGALDVALGVRGLAKGIKTGNKEKKILGMLDIGTGIAMGAACVLTGVPGIAVVAAGSAGMLYRTWRTDKKAIKGYIKEGKKRIKKLGKKINNKLKKLFNSKE